MNLPPEVLQQALLLGLAQLAGLTLAPQPNVGAVGGAAEATAQLQHAGQAAGTDVVMTFAGMGDAASSESSGSGRKR